MFDRHSQSFDEARALGVGDSGRGEALFNPIERINRRRRGAVVVVLQGLDKLCGGADDCDAAVSVAGRRIEHTKAEACGEKTAQCSVDFRYRNEVPMHGIDESGVGLPFPKRHSTSVPAFTAAAAA
jgi:hypothetical protein